MRTRRVVAVGGWAGFIFFLSSLPNPPGQTSVEWPSYLVHAAEFGVLAGLLLRTLGVFAHDRSRLALAAVAWFLAAAYGVSDEWHQSFVPNRDVSALDVGFDALGAALGCALWWFLASRGTKRAA